MTQRTTVKALLISTLLAASVSAYAAEQACVSLLVGAGYAAKMRINSGSFNTDWSDSFPIGQTRCQSLDGVPVGNTYTVQVSAVLGETKDCSPKIVHSTGQGSITWQAWGTTLNVKCEMPTAKSAMSNEADYRANADGIKAKESLTK